MKKNNVILITGFLVNPNQHEGGFHAGINISSNIAAQGEEANYKNAFVNINSKEDLSAFEGKRVTVEGFVGGQWFTPEGSEKEVSKMIVTSARVKELADGERGNNSISVDAYCNYTREFGTVGIAGLLGKSAKDDEGVKKSVTINFAGSRETFTAVKGDYKRFNGFLKVEAFTPKGSSDEVTKVTMQVMSVEDVPARDGSSNEAAQTADDATTAGTKKKTPAKKKTTAKKEQEVPEIDIDDDEIPF